MLGGLCGSCDRSPYQPPTVAWQFRLVPINRHPDKCRSACDKSSRRSADRISRIVGNPQASDVVSPDAYGNSSLIGLLPVCPSSARDRGNPPSPRALTGITFHIYVRIYG